MLPITMVNDFDHSDGMYLAVFTLGGMHSTSIFNCLTSFENFLSLFWGIPHRKTVSDIAIYLYQSFIFDGNQS